MLNQTGMANFRESEPQYLSGDQKQRATTTGILTIGLEPIILDESTSMPDPAGKFKVLKLIGKL